MKIAVFGAGYVGSVSGACIASQGFDVTLVDVTQAKVDLINEGQSPIVEAGLPELIRAGVQGGRLRATGDAAAAVHATDLCLICVGTPSLANGDLNLGYVEQVCAQIGAALRERAGYYSVVVRSTMLPGSMYGTVIPTLERHSGMRAGKDFGIAIYPEFLRESTALDDYGNPAIILIGHEDEETLRRLRALNARIESREVLTDIKTAEAVKYANNAWHATKIAFANEVGNLCKSAGIDGHKVMDVVCQDRRLNISPAYMRPGFAFGGSCLPKDLRALRALGRRNDVATPLFDAVLQANELQIRKAFDMVESTGRRRVGMLGLTFKSGTDDLRESPLVELAERLYGKGYELRIFDRNIQIPRLVGANRDYAATHLAHLSSMMVDSLDEVYDHADVIIVGNGDRDFAAAADRAAKDQTVIDLVRVRQELASNGQYNGICW
ncbi:MAG: nucleotide sugar dehydrogenase [Alphaproteobacteria bacterium]